MKKIAKITALLGLSAVTLSASGFRIPEQSIDATALSAAYAAGANGADASYYNPANMVWNKDGAQMEIDFTYIGLGSIQYTDSASSAYNGNSKKESFYVPTFHYVSPAVGDWRFGLSMVAPGGLSKRWDDAYAKATAQEFTLKVIELNPTAAYKINDQFALGFGLRGLYSSGVVKADAIHTSGATLYSEDMKGNSIDFGYNLAMSYKPVGNLTLSTTYRSKVNLTVKGTATGGISKYLLTHSAADLGTLLPYSSDATVDIPLPASLTLATAYTMNKTTIEFVFEKTYWSAYNSLDFNFNNAMAEGVLGSKKDKNWKDVNAYRIGVTHQYNDKLKLMAGFAIDKNPVPDNTLGFELPDSDAKLYSVGFDYKLNDKTTLGLAYLYDKKETRSVANRSGTSTTAPNGTFTDASAQLITASFKYKF